MAKAVGVGGDGRFRGDEIKKLQTDTKTMHETLATIAGQTGNVRIWCTRRGGRTNNSVAGALFGFSGLTLTTTTDPMVDAGWTSVGP